MSVRLCCQNGRTDRDADWGVESGAWAKETTYYMRIDITTGRGNFKGPGRDYSIINHLYVIEFPRTMYVPQTAMILLLSTEGVNCPKTIFGHKWAFSSQTRKILKLSYYDILQVEKTIYIFRVGGSNKSMMADGRRLENRKIAFAFHPRWLVSHLNLLP